MQSRRSFRVLSARGVLVLPLLLTFFFLGGCFGDNMTETPDWMVVDSAMEQATQTISDLETRLSALEADPEADDESKALAVSLRDEIATIKEWQVTAQTWIDTMKEKQPEDVLDVGIGIAEIASSAGVPYAGLVATVLGGLGAWRHERRKGQAIVTNVAPIIASAPDSVRAELKRLNLAAGVQDLVKSVTG